MRDDAGNSLDMGNRAGFRMNAVNALEEKIGRLRNEADQLESLAVHIRKGETLPERADLALWRLLLKP